MACTHGVRVRGKLFTKTFRKGFAVPKTPTAPVATTPLATREDLISWLRELLPDPFAYQATSGSTYPEDIRRLEWAVRPLWAIFSLLASGEYPEDLVAPYLARIQDGLTSEGSLAFPDPTLKTRQIVVEQEVFGYGLLVAGPQLLAALTSAQQDRLVEWLNASNNVELPWGSWFASRSLINEGLKANGLPYDADRLDQDVRALNSMYAGGGWYENGRPYQRDYYIPLVFQSAAMLTSHFAPAATPETRELVAQREAAFEDDFVCWSDAQGRTVPFGRSLFYRFGHVSFWSACALTGIHKRPLSEVKHLILQNLRWWKEHLQGGLVPGYVYPSPELVENYCAPGSPLRALRALTILALPPKHEFWHVAEAAPERPAVSVQQEPGVLAVSGPHHAYLFSATQFGGPSVSLGMSKYGKLCYSSAFGWNIPRDVHGLENFAVDSCLALAPAGFDCYVSRERSDMGEVTGRFAYTTWHVGELARVETWLVPLSEMAHVRIHRVEAFTDLDTCEGAFPLFAWNPKVDQPEEQDPGRILLSRVTPENKRWRSGILDASAEGKKIAEALDEAGLGTLTHGTAWTKRAEGVVLQDPNTNIYSYERSAVPVLKARVKAGTTWFAALVVGEAGV